MGLAYLILGTVNNITDESKYQEYEKEISRSELENFHEAIEQRAHFAAEWDHFREKPEVYWNAAKASVVLEIVGDFDAITSPRFKPSEAALPFDKEDAELIYSAMRFPGIQRNLHRFVNGQAKEYIREKWSDWLKKDPEPK